jgi:hypothetical protein
MTSTTERMEQHTAAADAASLSDAKLRAHAEAELREHVDEHGEELGASVYAGVVEARAFDIAAATMAAGVWSDPGIRLETFLSLLADPRVAAASVLPPQRVAVGALLARLLPGSFGTCPGAEGSRT